MPNLTNEQLWQLQFHMREFSNIVSQLGTPEGRVTRGAGGIGGPALPNPTIGSGGSTSRSRSRSRNRSRSRTRSTTATTP